MTQEIFMQTGIDEHGNAVLLCASKTAQEAVGYIVSGLPISKYLEQLEHVYSESR